MNSDDHDFLETWTPYGVGTWYGYTIDPYIQRLCEEADASVMRPMHINSGGCERP